MLRKLIISRSPGEKAFFLGNPRSQGMVGRPLFLDEKHPLMGSVENAQGMPGDVRTQLPNTLPSYSQL